MSRVGPGVRRVVIALAFVAFAIAWASTTRAANVVELRPYDAPRSDTTARLPPIPPEYLTYDQGWIRFAYHPSARERVRPLIADAEQVRAELTELLGTSVLATVEVRVAAVPAEMARLAPVELPSYAPAIVLVDQRVVILSVASPLSLEPPDLRDHFRHELAHLALDDAARGHALPRWFHEGFATYASGENTAERTETLAIASLRLRTIGLADLEPNFPADAPEASLAYAQSADFVRFLRATSAKSFRTAVERLGQGDPFEPALASAYGGELSSLERAWRKDAARRYSFLPVLIAGLALGLTGVGLSMARRLRNRQSPTSRRRARRGDGAARVRALSARERLLRDPAIQIVASRGIRDDLGENVPPDPDVPKVEHDGRWYTLH